MIKIKKYVACDNCGWETRIDTTESIKDTNYIEYGNFHFVVQIVKKNL